MNPLNLRTIEVKLSTCFFMPMSDGAGVLIHLGSGEMPFELFLLI